MTATDSFFAWFYSGLNGLGGWFVFLLVALAAAIWLFYDSASRRLPTLGWRLSVVLTAALLIPAMLYRFSGSETQLSLSPFVEWIFYLGLLGGLVPLVLAIGYYITYQGIVGCEHGHIYESRFAECPECSRRALDLAARSPQPVYVNPPPPTPPSPPYIPPVPQRAVVHAWLISDNNRRYELYEGQTTIGRSSKNDIHITNDTTVSGQHAKIIEQNGHFKLIDVGSRNGTRVNGRLVQSETLVNNDKIQLGDNTHLRFVSAG